MYYNSRMFLSLLNLNVTFSGPSRMVTQPHLNEHVHLLLVVSMTLKHPRQNI